MIQDRDKSIIYYPKIAIQGNSIFTAASIYSTANVLHLKMKSIFKYLLLAVCASLCVAEDQKAYPPPEIDDPDVVVLTKGKSFTNIFTHLRQITIVNLLKIILLL